MVRVNVSGGAKGPGGSSCPVPTGHMGETASALQSSLNCSSWGGRAGKPLGSSQPAPQFPQRPAHAVPNSWCLTHPSESPQVPLHTARLSSRRSTQGQAIFPLGIFPLGSGGKQEKSLSDSDCCPFFLRSPIYFHTARSSGH